MNNGKIGKQAKRTKTTTNSNMQQEKVDVAQIMTTKVAQFQITKDTVALIIHNVGDLKSASFERGDATHQNINTKHAMLVGFDQPAPHEPFQQAKREKKPTQPQTYLCTSKFRTLQYDKNNLQAKITTQASSSFSVFSGHINRDLFVFDHRPLKLMMGSQFFSCKWGAFMVINFMSVTCKKYPKNLNISGISFCGSYHSGCFSIMTEIFEFVSAELYRESVVFIPWWLLHSKSVGRLSLFGQRTSPSRTQKTGSTNRKNT